MKKKYADIKRDFRKTQSAWRLTMLEMVETALESGVLINRLHSEVSSEEWLHAFSDDPEPWGHPIPLNREEGERLMRLASRATEVRAIANKATLKVVADALQDDQCDSAAKLFKYLDDQDIRKIFEGNNRLRLF